MRLALLESRQPFSQLLNQFLTNLFILARYIFHIPLLFCPTRTEIVFEATLLRPPLENAGFSDPKIVRVYENSLYGKRHFPQKCLP